MRLRNRGSPMRSRQAWGTAIQLGSLCRVATHRDRQVTTGHKPGARPAGAESGSVAGGASAGSRLHMLGSVLHCLLANGIGTMSGSLRRPDRFSSRSTSTAACRLRPARGASNSKASGTPVRTVEAARAGWLPTKEASKSMGSNDQTVFRLKGERCVRGRRLDVQPSMSATLTPRILMLPAIWGQLRKRAK